MKLLGKIVLGLIVVIALIVGYAALTQPNDFKVERSQVINAPAAVIYPLVADLHKANDWSPWAEMDPGMKHTYAGPESGVGASHAWEGNDKVGVGSQTITEVKPDELVRVKLEFKKPMQGTNMVDFTLAPEGTGTKVGWKMYGPMPLISKVMCLFFNMDKMIGPDFEKGLGKLKTLAEAEAAKAPAKPSKKK
jgi:hypothetical protein